MGVENATRPRSEANEVWVAALRAAAAVARQAATGEEDVLRAVTEELGRLRLRGGICLLTPEGDLEVRDASLSRGLLAALQRLTGLKVNGYRFNPQEVAIYRQALSGGEAVFTADRAEVVGQLLPPPLRPLLPRIMRLLGPHGVIVAPVVLADQPLGTINVTAPWLTPQDLPLVAALADHVAIALGHVRSRTDMQTALRRERLRHQVAEVVASALDLPEVLDRVLKVAVEVTGADAGAIALLDEDGRRLHFPHLIGLPEDLRAQISTTGEGLAWKVIRSRQPLLIDDYAQQPEALPAWLAAGVHAMIGVPLAVGERVIGAMALFDKRPGRSFLPDQVEMVHTLARMAAVAIQNARLFAQATRRAEEAQALIQTARSISASLDLQTVLDRIAEQARALLTSEGSRIHLYDAERGVLRCVVAQHPDAEALRALELAPGLGLTGVVFQRGESLIVNNPRDYPQAVHVPGTPEDEPEVLAMTPLKIRQRIIGVMTVLRAGLERPYQASDIDLLAAFAAHAAIAIENADLYGQIASQAHHLEAEVVKRTRQLAQSEARYRSLVETSVAGIFQSDTEGRVIYANQAFAAQLGLPEDQVVGRALADLQPPEARQASIERFRARLRGERPPREVYEVEFAAAAGKPAPFLVGMSLIVDEDGKPQGVTGLVLDVSERKALEAALQDERDRLHAILTNVGDAVMVMDLSEAIEYVNPAWERQNGYSAAEAVGQSWRLLESGKHPASLYREMWEAIREGKTWRGELINRRRDGSLYDAVVTITPVRSDEGKLINFVGVQSDISALKEVDRLKSQFVSDVSHELRTPLTNIRLYLDLLNQTQETSKLAAYLETLSRESDRLAHLIDDLLSLSRLEAGATPFTPAPVDLNALLGGLAEDRRTLAAQRGLQLSLDCDPSLPKALGDTRLLTQVLTNLLTNAMNYTPEGGKIALRTGRRRGFDADWVTAEVRDTGPGIPPEEQPFLFRRFFRGRASHASGAAGTGLGLAICKEIAELHGGRITLESEGVPGRGACFTVWLPDAESRTPAGPGA